MTAAIDDVSGLSGKKVADQEQNPIGKVRDVYAVDGDGTPAWVSIDASFGLADKRVVLVPLARLKQEGDELVVPYSKDHIKATPEVDGDELSPEDERRLRDHFGIDRADHELRTDNDSYATLVPREEDATIRRAEDPDSLETPDADRIDDETRERLKDPGSAEMRQIDAGEIADQATGGGRQGSGAGNAEAEDGEDPKTGAEGEGRKA